MITRILINLILVSWVFDLRRLLRLLLAAIHLSSYEKSLCFHFRNLNDNRQQNMPASSYQIDFLSGKLHRPIQCGR